MNIPETITHPLRTNTYQTKAPNIIFETLKYTSLKEKLSSHLYSLSGTKDETFQYVWHGRGWK
jgi:hypothetical protein